MSRASKVFLSGSLAFMGATIWAVHHLQQAESDAMYQGVVKDEARVRARAEEKARLAANATSEPVLQPAAVIDEECSTCVISPPPQLLEAQSKEERARERAARLAEYEQQKGLAAQLEKQQGVSEPVGGQPARLV